MLSLRSVRRDHQSNNDTIFRALVSIIPANMHKPAHTGQGQVKSYLETGVCYSKLEATPAIAVAVFHINSFVPWIICILDNSKSLFPTKPGFA